MKQLNVPLVKYLRNAVMNATELVKIFNRMNHAKHRALKDVDVHRAKAWTIQMNAFQQKCVLARTKV